MPSTNFYDIDIDDYQEEVEVHHHQPTTINGSSTTAKSSSSPSTATNNHKIRSLKAPNDHLNQQQNGGAIVNGGHQNNDGGGGGKHHSLAVKVENIAYSYYRKKPVLKNVSLFVPEGKIFALLGSNGCGKTTMLRMILGRLKPETGFIRVFGVEPASTHSRIPGPGVGYMPQEISLIPEFTIEETLKYFGQIYHMDSRHLYDRIEKLFELLNLPDRDRIVRQLSGGQKRLVSLAVTLVHQPPLVILDEPTVGVDSVLRYRIWNHLEHMCKTEGTSVIITTHYIEEAKEAHNVGFIESGTVLAQSTPSKLQEQYKCNTLEEVFLKLCLSRYSRKDHQQPQQQQQQQQQILKFNSNTATATTTTAIQSNGTYRPLTHEFDPSSTSSTSKSSNNQEELQYKEHKGERITIKERLRKEIDNERLKAMIWKSFIRVKRNPLVLIMFHMIPIMTITLFSLTILRSPHNMPIAIYPGDIHGGNLSKTFIDVMDEYFLKKRIFNSPEKALESVQKGQSYYGMIFSDNFTESFTSRYIDVYRSSVDEIEIESSKIRLYPDNSNFIFAVYMRRAVLNYFEVFMRKFSTDLGYNPITFNLPIYVEEPIYGKMETDLGHYLVSALIVFSLFALPMVIGSLLIVMDRKDGYQERAFVAGVKPLEILSGHMLTCFVAVLSQVFLTLMLSFVILELDNEGSLLEIFILIFLQGIQGLSIGLVISTICVNEIFASIAVVSIILPMLLTSGSMWPMEGLPDILQKLIFLNPITLTIRSVRLVMLRGWSYQHFEVLIGYITTTSYTFICFISSIFLFHLISNSTIRIPFLPHYH
uniref:ABC transporter G family member 23-like n=1 Tax=Dermatophagoides pteronyssinus TaxID=6956 RepID=A0A6P6Y9B0_DERPT|nr:ABC transporter G family member 23-like [Dermatophagoides pteronyssinus]